MTAPDTTTDRAHWAWRPVVTAVLALVAWSVSTYLHDYVHVPWMLAILGAAVFDFSALILADLAHRATKAGDTAAALVYGFGVALFTTASAYVNWLHAQVAGWGTAGGILFAGAPIAAEILFVAQHWFQHRRKLRQDDKLGSPLPRLGLLSWSFFPGRSRRVIKAIIESRLDTIQMEAMRIGDAARAASGDAHNAAPHRPEVTAASDDAQHIVITLQQPRAISAAPHDASRRLASDAPDVTARQNRDTASRIITVPQPAMADAGAADSDAAAGDVDFASLSKAAAVRTMREALPDATAQQIADALAPHGITADASYVRTVLSRAAKAPQQGTGGYL